MSINSELPDIGLVETTTIDGLQIRLTRSGPVDGTPVLLTSPWPESIYAFRDLIPQLASQHTVVALDLPGFGQSESRPEIMSPQGMANFIVKAAVELGITRMHAIGPDIGTPTLLFAAARKPELFESLVIGGGATRVDLAAGQLKDLIASPPGAFNDIDGGPIGAEFVTQSAFLKIPPSVIEDYRRASEGGRFENAVSFVRAYLHDLPRLEQLLPDIETPTLIIVGKNDPIVPPENGQFIAEHLPHARYVELDGGHLIWEDAPNSYASEVMRWLSENRGKF